MIERVRSKRPIKGRGGRRPGSGRKLGSVGEAKRVARARAAREDMLPHELLLLWARTGRMLYPKGRVEELEPSDRIACAKGCAAWYKPAMQARQAPVEQPPVVMVKLDEKMVTALAANAPDKLEVLRDVLRAVGAGAGLARDAGSPDGVNPTRYGRMLSESSDVAGRA